jgi:hypothetical protein
MANFKVFFHDKSRRDLDMNADGDTAMGDNLIYATQSKTLNTIVVVNESEANVIVDNRSFKIEPTAK